MRAPRSRSNLEQKRSVVVVVVVVVGSGILKSTKGRQAAGSKTRLRRDHLIEFPKHEKDLAIDNIFYSRLRVLSHSEDF